MRASNIGGGSSSDGFDGTSIPDPALSGSTPRKALGGPLSGLESDAPRPSAGSRGISNSPDTIGPDQPETVVKPPFIIDYKARSITREGKPCLVPVGNKARPLTPKEFEAAALLILMMGDYVSIETLCSELKIDPARLKPIISAVRRALKLGSSRDVETASIVLMPDKSREGRGIFIIPRHHSDIASNDFLRGTREALLSDLGPDASLIALPADDSVLVVQLEEQTVRIHVGSITGSAEPHFRTTRGSSGSDPANDAHDILIGWERGRGVYGIRRHGQNTYISNALLDDGKALNIAYALDASSDIANNVFTVESTFAAKPDMLATALKQYLLHQRSRAEGIPSNVTTLRDEQAKILECLGATQHGLLGVNPLSVYNLPPRLPAYAVVYVDDIRPHASRDYLEIRPRLPGQKQNIAATFYQREGIATLVIGLYDYEDTTLVAAWDPTSRPASKDIRMSVDRETLRLAKQTNDIVRQPERNLPKGRSAEVLVAPLTHLPKLIEKRLQKPAKQRMIDALGGDSSEQEDLNEDTWTMIIDERHIQFQWCGPLLRGDASSHIRPFGIADRFVAPAPDAVTLYVGHDSRHDVVVLWRPLPGEPLHERKIFGIPDSVIEAASGTDTGTGTHVTRIGTSRLIEREAVASRCEAAPLISAVRYLSRNEDRRETWRSRHTDIHQHVHTDLQPSEWSDWKQDQTRPWRATAKLRTLGDQPLDIFAYPARVSEMRRGDLFVEIQPSIPDFGGRTSLFAVGREPVLIGKLPGKWDDIYILFDPRVRPIIKGNSRVSITVSLEQIEAVRKRHVVPIPHRHEHREFEETVILATSGHLRDALDLRLRTLPKVNFELIRERLNMNDPQALAVMAMRLQRAMRLPDREALTGTRDIPGEMVVVSGPPDGVKVIAVGREIEEALATPPALDAAHLLWLKSDAPHSAVILNARLRAILQPGEAPRWPDPQQFDVLWALAHAAAHDGTISDDLVQIACRHSLQWLVLGEIAPFKLYRYGSPGSYKVKLRNTVANTHRLLTLRESSFAQVFNRSTLYAPPKARPDIVWAFIKRVGPARIVPMTSACADDVAFDLQGQRIWVYGLTNTLRTSKDGKNHFARPALTPAQLSRIRSHPNDHHILAAFDAAPNGERHHNCWVFWSAKQHIDQLRDPSYRLKVSANLPDTATQERRQLDDNREERVVIYRSSRATENMAKLLKRLTVKLPQEYIASLEAQASKNGFTLGQVIGAMTPRDQIAILRKYNLTRHSEWLSRAETEATPSVGEAQLGRLFQRALHLARGYRDAGEPLPELDEIIGLLRRQDAEHYMGSRILLSMLRQLYGLESDDNPASIAHVFGGLGFERGEWHRLYRELIMRLIRGANKNGIKTAASFDIEPVARTIAPTSTEQNGSRPTMPPSIQPALTEDRMPGGGQRLLRREFVAAIALPDNEQLKANYASAIADFQRERRVAWPPDVPVPVASSWLPPDVESVMRAYWGVWPYRHRYTAEQIMAEFGIRSLRESHFLISRASDELLAHAKLLSGAGSLRKAARPTLELLCQLLIDRSGELTDDELHAVLARHGLAGVELIVSEITRHGALEEVKPSESYRRAMRKLIDNGFIATDTEDNLPHWQPEQIAEIYKRIDAGEFARLLLLLHAPETRDETFADMALRSVAVVGRRRAHRAAAMQGRGKNIMRHGETTLEYEHAVADSLGYDPSIEAFLQRADQLDAVCDRARALTEEETQLLQAIVDDGTLAFDEFLSANRKLAHRAVSLSGADTTRSRTDLGVDGSDYADANSNEIFVDARAGLERAIWGYNPEMSAFSTYALPVIRSTVFKLSIARYATRLEVSWDRAQEIIMTRTVRDRLKKAAANGPQREPTLEQLARGVLEPLLRARLIRKLKAEPTATQMEAGWSEHMPEFLSRTQENLEFIEKYDAALRKMALNSSRNVDGGKLSDGLSGHAELPAKKIAAKQGARRSAGRNRPTDTAPPHDAQPTTQPTSSDGLSGTKDETNTSRQATPAAARAGAAGGIDMSIPISGSDIDGCDRDFNKLYLAALNKASPPSLRIAVLGELAQLLEEGRVSPALKIKMEGVVQRDLGILLLSTADAADAQIVNAFRLHLRTIEHHPNPLERASATTALAKLLWRLPDTDRAGPGTNLRVVMYRRLMDTTLHALKNPKDDRHRAILSGAYVAMIDAVENLPLDVQPAMIRVLIQNLRLLSNEDRGTPMATPFFVCYSKLDAVLLKRGRSKVIRPPNDELMIEARKRLSAIQRATLDAH